MKPVVFVQARADEQPYSVHGMVAVKGFAQLGYDVRLFQRADLKDLPLTRDTVVVGGMGTVRDALEQTGIRPPSLVSVPASLYPFLGRECWRATIQEVRRSGRFPIFLKPYDQAKVFSGLVVHNSEELDRLVAPREGFPPIEDDFPLLAQTPVIFQSEWRVFVVRGVIIGVNFYAGDPVRFPSGSVITRAVGAHQQAPAGYSADFGVTDKGETLLVEINDGYSLGHGGLTPNLYAELLQARWLEMTGA